MLLDIPTVMLLEKGFSLKFLAALHFLLAFIGNQADNVWAVVDDSEAIFTPCCYRIGGVKVFEGVRVEPVEEIVSFRGRFCEQARNGRVVFAQGKVERVQGEENLNITGCFQGTRFEIT